MPQFDVLCFGTLVWSLIIILFLFYYFFITKILPSFMEIKKLRLKKISESNLLKQSVIIKYFLKYNLKLKKICKNL